MRKILLIIPAYNEEKNILNTVKNVERYIKEHQEAYRIDYVVINDGSRDETEKLLKREKKPAINLIQNLGIGGAVQTGYIYANQNGYDIAVQFDGDGQHDINYLHTIVEPLIKQEADFCVGSRFLEKNVSGFQSSRVRQMGINFLSVMIKLTTGKKIFDVTSGFRAANKKVIRLFARNYPQEFPEPESLVYLHKNNFTITEKPVNMYERTEGESSINSFKSIKYMVEVSLAVVISSFLKEGE